MKWVIIFSTFLLFATIDAAPQGSQDATILSYKNDINPEAYEFAFETSDGTSRSEKGIIKNPGTDNEILEVNGYYSYTGPDGKAYRVNYIADENGFRHQGTPSESAPISPHARILPLGEILAG